MKQSAYKSLNWRDLQRNFLLGFIAFALTFIQETLLPSLNIPMEIKLPINYFIAYLIKNYFTKPSINRIVGDRPPSDGGR